MTEVRDSDFKNAFPGIFNFTVRILKSVIKLTSLWITISNGEIIWIKVTLMTFWTWWMHFKTIESKLLFLYFLCSNKINKWSISFNQCFSNQHDRYWVNSIIFDNIENNQCIHALHAYSWSLFRVRLRRFLYQGGLFLNLLYVTAGGSNKRIRSII